MKMRKVFAAVLAASMLAGGMATPVNAIEERYRLGGVSYTEIVSSGWDVNSYWNWHENGCAMAIFPDNHIYTMDTNAKKLYYVLTAKGEKPDIGAISGVKHIAPLEEFQKVNKNKRWELHTSSRYTGSSIREQVWIIDYEGESGEDLYQIPGVNYVDVVGMNMRESIYHECHLVADLPDTVDPYEYGIGVTGAEVYTYYEPEKSFAPDGYTRWNLWFRSAGDGKYYDDDGRDVFTSELSEREMEERGYAEDTEERRVYYSTRQDAAVQTINVYDELKKQGYKVNWYLIVPTLLAYLKKPVSLGDVNSDKKLTLQDVSLQLQYYAQKAIGNITIQDQVDVSQIDADGNGFFTFEDVTELLHQYAAAAAGLTEAN